MQNYSGDSSVILLDYSCDTDHGSLESSVHVVDFEGASPASSVVQVNFSPAATRVCSLMNSSPISTSLKAQAQSTPVPLSGHHAILRNSSSNMSCKHTPRMIDFTISTDEPEAKRRKTDSEPSLLSCCVPLEFDTSVSTSVGSSSALSAAGLNLSVIGWDLMSIWKMNGCGECCASRKHGVHATDVFVYHNHYSQLPKQARQQWLLDYFNMQSSKDVHTGESETAYLVCGKHVCQSLWIATIGISQSFFYEMKKCFLQGQVKIHHEVQRRPLQRTTEASAWMDNFFNLIGDHMPHQMGIHLPSSLTKVSVYQRMLSELKSRGKVSIISKAHFFKLWEEQFSQVTIPKENRFTKCDICTMVKREKEKTMNEEKLKELDEILKDHNDLQMDQRKRYHSIREKAETDPSIISMIIDGMDQNKTNVPHLKRIEKSACNLWQLRTHLTGVLVHGHWAAACFDLHQWPHDPNLTMNVLLLILLERFKQIVNQKGKLPTRLFIQMDNCGRENKNQYVLAFLFLLVELKVFDEIQLGFLMKGHTHEDVDALFGNIRKWLQRHDATTLPALMEGCKQANYNVRSLSLLPKMFNIKGWLSPFIEAITGHSNPHVFRFVKGSNGHSQMFYKQWNGDRWEPTDGVGETLLKGTPVGVPSLVQPSGAKIDIEQLRHDIPKYNALSDGDKQWWHQFLEEVESSLNSTVSTCSTWPLEELLDITKSHPRVQLNVEHASEQLQQLHQSTKKTHVVRVGKSGRKQPNKGTEDTSESSKKKQSSKKASSSGSRVGQRNNTTSESDTQNPPSNTNKKADSEKTSKIIDPAEVKTGDFVAVSHHYWLNEPLIGEVLEVQLAILRIQWWCGSYRSAWQIEKVKENGEMELHQEEITKRQILLAFSWEKKQPMKIPDEIKIKLKDLYSKLHDKS